MNAFSTNDYVEYRLKRSLETLDEVDKLVELAYWNTAVNRLYYAAFYAVSALLTFHKIQVHSHTGIRQKFGEYFIKTQIMDVRHGRLFAELFDKRQRGDYNDFYDFNKEGVIALLSPTKLLVETIVQHIREAQKGE